MSLAMLYARDVTSIWWRADYKVTLDDDDSCYSTSNICEIILFHFSPPPHRLPLSDTIFAYFFPRKISNIYEAQKNYPRRFSWVFLRAMCASSVKKFSTSEKISFLFSTQSEIQFHTRNINRCDDCDLITAREPIDALREKKNQASWNMAEWKLRNRTMSH